MEKSRIIDVIEQAMKMEEDGQKFYIEVSKKTHNPLIEAAFKSLAEDETQHIKAIKAFYGQICEDKLCPNLDELLKHRRPSAKIAIFDEAKKKCAGRVEVALDDKEAYKLAMELENKGIKLYSGMLKNAGTDTDLVKLLEFLVREEEFHYDLLQSTHEYLANPADWFMKEEKPIVEG